MRYRKSEELKATDVEWIGEIPEDWHLRKLKFLSEVNSSNVDKKSKEGEVAVKLCNYTDVYYNEFITNEIEFMKATASDKDIDRFQLVEGDIIITKDSESQDDMAVPTFVKETKENLLCGYHLAVIRSDKKILNGKYLFRIFQSRKYREEFGIRSNGITRYGLGVHQLKNISIYIPPLSEQRSIATFLDRKTEAIDALIQKKEQLIERLKEKRQALITQAVTKGLDPDSDGSGQAVPMKDSGIEWLGEMPEEWDLSKIKWLFKRVTSGSTPSSTEKTYYDGGKIPWVQTGDLNDGEISKTSKKITPLALEEISALKVFPKDTLLVAMYGATIGKLGILKQESATNQACCALIEPRNVYSKYLFFWLLAYRKEIISLAYGGGQPNISQDIIKNIRVSLPPLNEQKEILNYINKLQNNVKSLIGKTNEQIEKLKEYRHSIISAVVTGKVDVRGEELEAEQIETQSHTIEDIALLVMYFIDECHRRQTHFGRVMAVKNYVLLHYLLEINPKLVRFRRLPKGPHDPEFWEKMENLLEHKGWVTIEDKNKADAQVKYTRNRSIEYKSSLENRFTDDWSTIKKVVNEIANHDTKHAEILSTVYAAWNDLIIFGKEPSEENILNEVLKRWPGGEKQKITKSEWKRGIRRLESLGIEPKGFGKSTTEQPELL